MSAINIPYPDYPADRGHYENSVKKFETIAKLVISNARFQKDIEDVRKTFNITVGENDELDFKPRPYTPDSTYVSVKEADKLAPGLVKSIKDIASRIPLDGDMVSFVREYVFEGTYELLLLQHLRRSVTATVETAENGTKYVNLRLNGPVTLKDIEATWSNIGDKIAELYPYSRDKPRINNDNSDITWAMYSMRLAGLSDSEIANSINESTDNDSPVFTENGVGKKLSRLAEQIDKSYR